MGTLPSELGMCTLLEELLLARNTITGTLPTELGNLSLLRYLDMAENENIVGSIPTEFAGMKGLENFRIAFTKITGPVPSEMCDDVGADILVGGEYAQDCTCCRLATYGTTG